MKRREEKREEEEEEEDEEMSKCQNVVEQTKQVERHMVLFICNIVFFTVLYNGPTLYIIEENRKG